MINTSTLATTLSTYGTVKLCQYDASNTNLYIELTDVTIAQNDLDVIIDSLIIDFTFRIDSTLFNKNYKIVYTFIG